MLISSVESEWSLWSNEILFSVYRCVCKAVSDTVHYPFHSWDISSCKFCSCNDAAMINCESACKIMVENYANTGCGKVIKGSKVKHSYEASNCGSGYGANVYTCAWKMNKKF